MWENRSETLKEYTYDTSGFRRAAHPCTRLFLLIATPIAASLLIIYPPKLSQSPNSVRQERISFQAAPYGAKLHLTELRLTFLSSAES
jgi:hypothetical protein